MSYSIDIVGVNQKAKALIEKLKQERISASGCYFGNKYRIFVPVADVSYALNLMSSLGADFGAVAYDPVIKAIVFRETECQKGSNQE